MGHFCLDASFVLASVLPGQESPAARQRWSDFSRSDELVAPSLLWAECTSVLREHVYRRRLSSDVAMELLQLLLRLPIRSIHRPDLYERALHIADRFRWPKAYDAVYLAVAELEGAELITLDGEMHAGALRLSLPSTRGGP